MAFQIVPITAAPNQVLNCALTIDGAARNFQLTFRYNEIANYWVLTIFDVTANAIILDSIPLLTGSFPASNILQQYTYMQIGTLVLLNVSGVQGEPNATNLGTDFLLAWGDTPAGVGAGI